MTSLHIKSYVRRQGRITDLQRYALQHYWPIYGVDLIAGSMLDFKQLYLNDAPLLLEVGFGMGASLAHLAEKCPDWNFLGVDIHQPGIGALLATLHHKQLNNVRVIEHDAVEVIKQSIPSSTLDMIQILYPDPWPKRRHHKRRLIQKSFIDLIVDRLKPGGLLYIATDWQNYANHIESILAQSPLLKQRNPDTIEHPVMNIELSTKFEKRGKKLGHTIFKFLFQK
jgi:tRNA (guanine-N7-)-methyltransferase